MKISDLIEKLTQITTQYGDCEVLLWDPMHMKYDLEFGYKYIKESDFDKFLEDDPEYVRNFNMIKNNVIIY